MIRMTRWSVLYPILNSYTTLWDTTVYGFTIPHEEVHQWHASIDMVSPPWTRLVTFE